jgi:hypothetical protein
MRGSEANFLDPQVYTQQATNEAV